MKKMFKRVLSLLLSLVMALGLLSGLTFSSNAEQSSNCLANLECTDEGHYTGNLGDSRVFRLDGDYFNGYNPGGYIENGVAVAKRYGNVGVDGTVYENGFEVWIARWNYGDNISWAYRTFKLSGKYHTLTGKSGLIKSYNTKSFDDTVYFYNGSDLIYSFQVTPSNYNIDFTVNVDGVDELKVEIKDNTKAAGGTSFALYDLFLDGNTSKSNVFEENSYIADIWLNKHGSYTTSESKLIFEILSYDSISSLMYNELKEDTDFQKSVNRWEKMKIVFDPVKATGQTLDETDIYETLILDLLEKVAISNSEEISNVILDAVDVAGDAGKTVTKYKKMIDNLVKLVDNPSKSLLSVLKEWKFDPKCESFQKFYSSLNDIEDKTGKWTDNSFIEGVGAIAEVATDVSDFYERLVGYAYAVDMSDEMVVLLKQMQKNTKSVSFKTALQNVINSVDDAAFAAVFMTCTLGTNLGLDVVDTIFGELAKGIPIYNVLRAAYGAGVAFDNLMFNTSGVIDKYYLLQATYNFINANKASINELKEKYLKSSSSVEAAAYVYAVKTYHQVYMIDLESAVSFTKAATTEGVVNYVKIGINSILNLITGNNEKTTYEIIVESKDSISNSLNTLFDSLDNSWKFNEDYLQTDYPEIYSVYLSEEISQDKYSPEILSCYIEKSGKTNLQWSIPDVWYDESGTSHILYGSIWINGIVASETVGSNTSTQNYSDISNASNPLQFYNDSMFSTFPKTYKLKAYSSTSNGNVYTQSATKVIKNPLQTPQIELSLSNWKFKNYESGISIDIVDNTSVTYTFVKYKIYKKTNDSSWKLIKTLDRTFKMRGNTTTFIDTNISVDNSYSYKVVSVLSFDNGTTFTSSDSNIITLSKDSKTTRINTITTERFSKYDSKISRSSSRASDSEETIDSVLLSWDAMSGAEQYEIYRKVSYGSVYNLIATVDSTTLTYVDSNVENGTEYSYYVIPCSTSGNEKSYNIDAYAQGEISYYTKIVHSVSVNDISLNYKSSTTLKPTITADSGVKYTVKYSSSNTKVATVDDNGKVTATKRGSGSATITCTVTDEYGNTVSDTCKVDVSLNFGQKLIVYVLFGWIWY